MGLRIHVKWGNDMKLKYNNLLFRTGHQIPYELVSTYKLSVHININKIKRNILKSKTSIT